MVVWYGKNCHKDLGLIIYIRIKVPQGKNFRDKDTEKNCLNFYLQIKNDKIRILVATVSGNTTFT